MKIEKYSVVENWGRKWSGESGEVCRYVITRRKLHIGHFQSHKIRSNSILETRIFLIHEDIHSNNRNKL